MPLYEYQCKQCAERVEIIQRVSDPPYTRCPKCGGQMRKLISSPAIQFKGSGFYKTDYASKPAGSAEQKSEKNKEVKTEAKSDSKPNE
jgi:putative FmdB family regulatory protein